MDKNGDSNVRAPFVYPTAAPSVAWAAEPEEAAPAAANSTLLQDTPPGWPSSSKMHRPTVHKAPRGSGRAASGATGVLAARRRMSMDLANKRLSLDLAKMEAPGFGVRPPSQERFPSVAATAAAASPSTLQQLSATARGSTEAWLPLPEGGTGGQAAGNSSGSRALAAWAEVEGADDGAGLQYSRSSSSLDSEGVAQQDPSNELLKTSSIRSGLAQLRLKGLVIVDHAATTWVLIIMTMFVIFQEDMKYAAFPPTADVVFESVTLAMLLLFLLELAVSSLVRPGFFLSFYWWLDVVATISLGFELPALRAALLLGATQTYVDLNEQDSYLYSAGAAALVSSKAGRAAKMVRLFRQLQLIRLFKEFELQQQQRHSSRAGADAAGLPTLGSHTAGSDSIWTQRELNSDFGAGPHLGGRDSGSMAADELLDPTEVPSSKQQQQKTDPKQGAGLQLHRSKSSALMKFQSVVVAAGAAAGAVAAAALGAAAGTMAAAAAGAAAAAAAVAVNLEAAEQRVESRYKWSNSRVGHRLSDLTIKRVIAGVLAMLLVLPTLEVGSGLYGEHPSLLLAGLAMLHSTAITQGLNSTGCQAALSVFLDGAPFRLGNKLTGRLLELRVANATIIPAPPASTPYRYLELEAAEARSWLCPNSTLPTEQPLTGQVSGQTSVNLFDDLRQAASVAVGPMGAARIEDATLRLSVDHLKLMGCQPVSSWVLSDVRWLVQSQSIFGICRTLFLVVLLALGAKFIHSDTRRLVLLPVERMVTRVRDMAEDPLGQATMPGLTRRGQLESSGGGGHANTSSDGGGAWGDTQSKSTGALLAVKAAVRLASLPNLRTAAHLSSPGLGAESDAGDTTMASRKVSFAAGLGKRADSLDPGLPLNTRGPSCSLGEGDSEQRPPSRALCTVRSRHGSFVVFGGSGPAGVVPRQQPAADSPPSFIRVPPSRLIRSLKRVCAWCQLVLSAAWRSALSAAATLGRWLSLTGDDEGEDDQSTGQYETRVLERSIHKICSLLAVGFGDAGAQVIAENIKQDGDLNPMLPGKKTVAIFGFCDIRRFTDTTEVLEEEVMEYVNTIAHIVHTAVTTHGGAANKNIGDAFLLVWKFPKGVRTRDINAMSSSGGGGGAARGSRSTKGGAAGGRAGGGARNSTHGPGQSMWPSLFGTLPQHQHHHQQHQQQQLQLEAVHGTSHQMLLGVPSDSPRTSGGQEQLGTNRQAHPPAPAADPVHPGHSNTDSSGSAGITALAAGPPSCLPSRSAADSAQQEGGTTLSCSVSGLQELQQQQPSSPHSRGSSLVTEGDRGSGCISSAGGGHRGSVLGVLGADVVANVSVTGGKRSMLNMKSIKHVPMNAPAKASIISNIADNALAAFVITQVALKLSPKLAAYNARPDLLARMPDFAVQMGFGLHVGWAIEGAIGSEYKIDASYLSPNVNLASRLEAATKQFGVDLLLSQDFVDCLSSRVRTRVRQVDCVMLKGSQLPMALYTYDLDTAAAIAAAQQLAVAAVQGQVLEVPWATPAAAAGGGAGPAGCWFRPVAEGAEQESYLGAAAPAAVAAGGGGGGAGVWFRPVEEGAEQESYLGAAAPAAVAAGGGCGGAGVWFRPVAEGAEQESYLGAAAPAAVAAGGGCGGAGGWFRPAAEGAEQESYSGAPPTAPAAAASPAVVGGLSPRRASVLVPASSNTTYSMPATDSTDLPQQHRVQQQQVLVPANATYIMPTNTDTTSVFHQHNVQQQQQVAEEEVQQQQQQQEEEQQLGQLDSCEALLYLECEDDWTDNPVLVNSWALSNAFRQTWGEALAAYLEGDWSKARPLLEHCLTARTNSCGKPVQDGPSRVLLEVLRQHGYKAPPGWCGCRELTEK